MSVSEKIMSMSATLSKKHNLLGKYILDNIYDVALMNAPQIARAAGVSEATLTRFVYTLGYNSFSELLLDLRKETINSKGIQFRQEPHTDSGGKIYRNVFDLEMDLMRETLGAIDPDAFDDASEMLLNCDHLLLVGGPIHNFLALYAANFICAYRENVHVVSQVDMMLISLLGMIGPKSTALVFSYPRYSSEVQRIAEVLAEKGVRIISVTDSKLSPIVPISQLYFITPQRYMVLADANACVLALIHSFMVSMYSKHSDKIKKKLENYEKNVLAADMFVYKDYDFVKKL